MTIYDMPETYEFRKSLAERHTTDAGETTVCGIRINPDYTDEIELETLATRSIGMETTIDNLTEGNVCAVKVDDTYNSYIITKPYEVNSLDPEKAKLHPINNELSIRRIIGDSPTAPVIGEVEVRTISDTYLLSILGEKSEALVRALEEN